MLVSIVDGYVDEPSMLGVPPYVSPYVREVVGVCEEIGGEWEYITIDQWRGGREIKGDVLVFIGGAVVPGKYLRTYPASVREVVQIGKSFRGLRILGGGLARFRQVSEGYDYYARKDVDALLYDILTNDFSGHRFHTLGEWNRWLLRGAKMVAKHPDFPNVMVEIESSRGCPRYISGGCSFCIEPLYGRPVFREVDDIYREMKTLAEIGVQNFRVGGQSCIYSYRAYGVGEKDVVEPNVGAVEELFSRISTLNPRVLHVDNANPAVIANYPDKGERITEILVKYTTPGNVLSFGMESADPEVRKRNNLNAGPEEVMEAIRIVNSLGAQRGKNGMPHLLPGLNFICGLWGESRRTYELNFRFLKEVLERGYLLRRINIRQVASTRNRFKLKYRHECWRFRKEVREKIDKMMLKRILPRGTILRDVYLELTRGNYTFGRQLGSYPIIVVLPYNRKLGEFVDVKVVDYGERSITAIEYPLNVNDAPFSTLKALPGIGEKKAAAIIRDKPLTAEKIKEKYPELVEFISEGV